MRCFKHVENESVALCTGCNKGVCQQCFTEVENKACCGSDTCKEDIREFFSIIERNKEDVSVSNNNLKNSGWFHGIIGIIFLISGLYTAKVDKYFDEFSMFSVALGIVFLFYGVFSSRKKRLYKQ